MHQFWFSSSIFVPFRISPQPIRRQARLIRREMATFSPIFVHTDCDNEIRALLKRGVNFTVDFWLKKRLDNSLRISLAHDHTRATRKRADIQHKIFMLLKRLDFRVFFKVSRIFPKARFCRNAWWNNPFLRVFPSLSFLSSWATPSKRGKRWVLISICR